METSNQSPPAQQARSLSLIASLGGVGRAKFMAGTWGSLAAAPPLLIIAFFFGYLGLLFIALILTLGGWLAVELIYRQEKKSQEQNNQEKNEQANQAKPEKQKWDPSWIVIDEAAGLAVALLPFAVQPSPLAVVLGFGLFRLLDITKPPPVRQLEALPSALGVMADDLGAGAGAALLTAAGLFFFGVAL